MSNGWSRASHLRSLYQEPPGKGRVSPNYLKEVALPNLSGSLASVLKFSWTSSISSDLKPSRNRKIETNRDSIIIHSWTKVSNTTCSLRLTKPITTSNSLLVRWKGKSQNKTLDRGGVRKKLTFSWMEIPLKGQNNFLTPCNITAPLIPKKIRGCPLLFQQSSFFFFVIASVMVCNACY